jgi:UDP-glucuronate 4-epimerase
MILVTGAAGFIGFHLCKKLLKLGHNVIGIDEFNSYYDVQLKEHRWDILSKNSNFISLRLSIENQILLEENLNQYPIEKICHLAGQAGVRYSVQNPRAYADSNLMGFFNLLEYCRLHQINRFVFASSSSVYGENSQVPYNEQDQVDQPISFYAATKKANELMAHSFSHIYGFQCIGLRFFSVYGPWGRPDMAYWGFCEKILKGESIDIYNYGDMKRDFTFIDDIVEGVVRTLDNTARSNIDWTGNNPDPGTSSAPWRIYNIGNNNPCTLLNFIEILEDCLGQKAIKNMLPMQKGDVPYTFANTDDLMKDVGYKPETKIEDGIAKFVEWYKDYYKID